MTAPDSAGMRASLVASTIMFAVARGVPMERISAATGLTHGDLIDPDAWLPQEIVPTVWRLLGEAYPGQAVALDMARAAPPSFFGTLGHAARFTSDLRAAIALFIRYQSVLSNTLQLTLVETESEAAVRVHHPMDAVDGGYGAEAGMGLGWRMIREVYGFDALARVEFSHAPLGPFEVYEEFFGTSAHFERSHNALVFRIEALDRSIAPPDPHSFRFIQGHLDLVRERLAAHTISDELARIRQAIAHNAERSEYGAEALARQLGMSLRAVQRLARSHGITVRELLDQAREANAREFLSDARLSIDEVSFLLGYSDHRAFRRAFKRRTGKTPAEFRRAGKSLRPQTPL